MSIVKRYHLDTDFLVKAVGGRGAEHTLLASLQQQNVELEMSAVAWYEFARGPRSPDQLARGRDHLNANGVIAFNEELAERAGDVFRRLGRPRRRAADIAIAVTAVSRGARLLTCNAADYSGIDGLLLGAQ